MKNPKQITMASGTTWRVGEIVRIRSGSAHGTGRIREIKVPNYGHVKFVLEHTVFVQGETNPLDIWPLKDGGFFNRFESHGVTGGNLTKFSGRFGAV